MLDEGTAQLKTEKEMLTSGCIVSLRAAGDKLVMRSHNVPMSPLHTKNEFLTVIQRAKFEESNYEKVRQATDTKYGFDEMLIYTAVKQFVMAYVDLMCKGADKEIPANQDANKDAVDSFSSQSAHLCFNDSDSFVAVCYFLVIFDLTLVFLVSTALSQKRRELQERLGYQDLKHEAQAMALQVLRCY